MYGILYLHKENIIKWLNVFFMYSVSGEVDAS